MNDETELDKEILNDILDDLTCECDRKMAVFDDFNDCLEYYSEDEDGNLRAVYCYEDMVASLMKRDNMTYEDAVDYLEFNTMRTIPYMTHIGNTETTTPIIIHRITQDILPSQPVKIVIGNKNE